MYTVVCDGFLHNVKLKNVMPVQIISSLFLIIFDWFRLYQNSRVFQIFISFILPLEETNIQSEMQIKKNAQ